MKHAKVLVFFFPDRTHTHPHIYTCIAVWLPRFRF